MADTHQIRCPQCATLYDEGEARCPHCGLPAEPAARQRHIEQLLEHTAAGPAAADKLLGSTRIAPDRAVDKTRLGCNARHNRPVLTGDGVFLQLPHEVKLRSFIPRDNHEA